MNEILLQLRKELNALIEVIDNYQPALDEVIIIKKEDLKHLKWKKKLNSYINLFEYKNSIRFTLPDSGSYPYQIGFYNRIMDGTLERLILNKIIYNNSSDEISNDTNSYQVNYKLEEWQKTKLRDNFNNDII
jgi:hypothetical protein